MITLLDIVIIIFYATLFLLILKHTDRIYAQKADTTPSNIWPLIIWTIICSVALYSCHISAGPVFGVLIEDMMCVAIIAIGAIDLRYRLIPNYLILICLGLTLCHYCCAAIIYYDRIFTAFTITFTFLIAKHIFKVKRKRDIIGYGDIKLIFIIFMNSAVITGISIIWLAALFGIIYAIYKKITAGIDVTKVAAPFGTCLSVVFILFYVSDKANYYLLGFLDI